METSPPTRQGSNDSALTRKETTPPLVILGEPQRLALEWLMGGGTITEAGQYAGVTRQTVSEWLNHDEDFRRAFQKWRLDVHTINHARLLALSEAALDTVNHAIRESRDVKVALVVLKSMRMLGEDG